MKPLTPKPTHHTFTSPCLYIGAVREKYCTAKIRLKPSCRISASFVALLFEKESPKSYSEGLRAVFFCRFAFVVLKCQVDMLKSFEKGGVLVFIATFVALDLLQVSRTMQEIEWKCRRSRVSSARCFPTRSLLASFGAEKSRTPQCFRLPSTPS